MAFRGYTEYPNEEICKKVDIMKAVHLSGRYVKWTVLKQRVSSRDETLMVANRLFEPVRILRTSVDRCQIVASVDDATRYLTESWPAGTSDVLEHALQACIDGLNDRIAPTEVREAFVKALNHACVAFDGDSDCGEDEFAAMRSTAESAER
jgi:hypothetical protein